MVFRHRPLDRFTTVGVGIMGAHKPLPRSGQAASPHPGLPPWDKTPSVREDKDDKHGPTETSGQCSAHAAPRQVATSAARAQYRPPPCSRTGMGMRRSSSSFKACRLACHLRRIVCRSTVKCLFRILPELWVQPKKLNVSSSPADGFPA